MSDNENGIDGDEGGTGVNPFAIGGTRIVDPTEVAGSDDSGEGTGNVAIEADAPKRRGRKPGSKNGTKKQKASSADISGLEKILFSCHIALAAATKLPELCIDADEAKRIAQAAAEVQSHYEVNLDPKMLAWTQLVIALGSVYAPRAIAIHTRMKADKESRNNVVRGNFNHAAS